MGPYPLEDLTRDAAILHLVSLSPDTLTSGGYMILNVLSTLFAYATTPGTACTFITNLIQILYGG